MKRFILILIPLIAMVTSGCNMLIKLPFGGPDLISTETFTINEAIPNDGTVTDVALTLTPSNASVVVAGQADGVTGEIQYNVADWKPSLVLDGTTVRITQPVPENNIFKTPEDAINIWDLTLGEPLTNISVTLSSGTYDLTFLDTLSDAMTIRVQSSVGNLRMAFPAGITVNVDVQNGVGNISTEGVWSHQRDAYTSGDAETVWTVQVTMGVGNLTLVSE